MEYTLFKCEWNYKTLWNSDIITHWRKVTEFWLLLMIHDIGRFNTRPEGTSVYILIFKYSFFCTQHNRIKLLPMKRIQTVTASINLISNRIISIINKRHSSIKPLPLFSLSLFVAAIISIWRRRLRKKRRVYTNPERVFAWR